MKSDLFLVLVWWFYILLLGMLALPFTSRLAQRCFDKGYLFAKTAGILTVSYAVWWLSSIKLMPFTRETILALMGAGFVGVLWRYRKNLQQLLREYGRIFMLEEALFLAALLFWCFVRGMQPNIYGLEKFVDFGFVNSLLHTAYMPPLDQWMAGETINYYYYGQYICAFLIKLTQLPPDVGYNVMIATLFAFTFGLTFSLTANLVHVVFPGRFKTALGGMVSALLMTMGGNLHTFFYAVWLPWAHKHGFTQAQVNPYWYPDATRFIGYNPPVPDKTIHEFPHYSFVVADLHAHLSGVPIVLSLLMTLFLYSIQPVSSLSSVRFFGFCKWTCMIGFLLALALMTNTWDFPIYLFLTGLVLLYRNCGQYRPWWRAVISTLVDGIHVVLFALVFSLPFALQFEPFSQGVRWVHAHTPLYQFMVLWGYQLIFVLTFVLALVALANKFVRQEENSSGSLKARLGAFTGSLPVVDKFVLLVALAAVVMLLVPEVIYIKDIYGEDHHRANTMFKFTYQSFIMFCAIIGYLMVATWQYLWQAQRRLCLVILPFQAILFVLPLLYPFWSIPSYYGQLDLKRYQGLSGMKFLQEQYLGDYEAVRWLKKNTTGQPVILEANGDSFTIANRISAMTGFPTILGWYVHEWLYRGNTSIINDRVAQVEQVYVSGDRSGVETLLNTYQIDYIVVGPLEKEKFKQLDETRLLSFGTLVFQSGDTKIIKVD